jgi:hypothetical protein
MVEVRKWIKVDVSASEWYWYWDEENIIANWSLSAENFTKDRQDIEFTLNNTFWWTKWELLDIVLYQENKSVNNTSYYVLWCDKTQWSEAFSYVSVNWTTRTRNYLMPYCISDWFLWTVLAKYWNATENKTWQSIRKDSRSLSWSNWNSNSATKTISTPILYYQCWCSRYRWANVSISWPWISWNSSYSSWWDSTSRETEKYDIRENPVSWDYNFSVGGVTSYWSWTLYLDYWSLVNATVKHHNSSDSKIKPREVKTIWQECKLTLFWWHIDWSFYIPYPMFELYQDNYSSDWGDITNFKWRIYVKCWDYIYYIPITWRWNAT